MSATGKRESSAGRLVVLQFLAVVLPVAAVLATQTVLDGRRMEDMARIRPLRNFAREARQDFKLFVNGAADAVDTGTLSTSAVDALRSSDGNMLRLMQAGADPALLQGADTELHALSTTLTRESTLAALLKTRASVHHLDELTGQIADEYERRDNDAIVAAGVSAARQRIAVLVAIAATAVLTIVFVVRARRRLARQQQADRALAEETLRIRNALDNCPLGIMVADHDAKVVYANRSVQDLLGNAGFGNGEPLAGLGLQAIAGDMHSSLRAGGQHEVQLGRRTFRVSSNAVADAAGEPAGWVLEWNDHTDQARLELELATIVSHAARGEFSQRINIAAEGTGNEFFDALVRGINTLMGTSEAGLNELAAMLEALSRGDLTQRMQSEYRGTFAKLRDYSNRTADQLQDMVGRIKTAAEAIDQMAAQISGATGELAEYSDEQAAGAQLTARSMQDITGLVRSSGERADTADRLASDTTRVARHGGELVGRAVTTMNDIAGSSRRIGDIIGVIDDLAFQTNILALNAAVEAARAGEHGRGFAVVATEVRSLAGRSAEAAREIRSLIEASIRTVENGKQLVDSAGNSMQEILSSIDRVTAMVREIAEASANQTRSVESVNRSIAQIDAATSGNKERVQGTATAARGLEQQAASLVESVSVFRLSESDCGSAPDELRKAS